MDFNELAQLSTVQRVPATSTSFLSGVSFGAKAIVISVDKTTEDMIK